jgi:hypothetical protein
MQVSRIISGLMFLDSAVKVRRPQSLLLTTYTASRLPEIQRADRILGPIPHDANS